MVIMIEKPSLINAPNIGVFVLIMILFPLTVLAQGKLEDPEVSSANAINLGLFGEIPVSLHAGLPQVEIPIYEVKASDINLPITLRYHASGVRPEVHPSWVGQGWSLSAGGAISRTVNGIEDESARPDILGYYFNHAQNNRASWASINYLSDYREDDLLRDAEPDEFHFSFPGHSGVFFMDENGAWRVQSDKPLKVVFDGDFIEPFSNTVNSHPKWQSGATFEKFTLIDAKGVQYVFGGENGIEYSDVLMTYRGSAGPDIGKSTATTWHLTKIISANNKDSIMLNYERGPYQASLYRSINVHLLKGPNCNNYGTDYRKLGGKLVSPVYLKSIENQKTGLLITFTKSKSNELSYTSKDFNELFNDHFDGTRRSISELVNFEDKIPYFDSPPGSTDTYDVSWERLIWLKLTSINISILDRSVKTIIFSYNNTPSERLKLSSVSFKESYSSSTGLSYGFDYYNDFPLPDYISVLGDHWGFSNSNSATSGITLENFYSLKSPTGLTHARSGSLKSITYPTGGKTTFDYERHTFSKAVHPTQRTVYPLSGVAGGLRIRSLTNYDNKGHEEVKDYYYVSGYEPGKAMSSFPSSGILEAEPKYSFAGDAVDIGGSPFSFSFFSSNPIIPVSSNTTGQHISYSEVVEKRGDGAYTIYKYTNHDNGFGDHPAVNTWNPSIVPYAPYNSTDFERGRILGEFLFKSNGKPVKSIEYEYERTDHPYSYGSRSISQNYKNNCVDNAVGTAITRTAYYLYYYHFPLKKITEKNYGSTNSSDVVTREETYSYNYHKLLSSEEYADSEGKKIRYNYSYAYDAPSSAGMWDKHMLDYKRTIVMSVDWQEVSSKTIEYNEWPTDPGCYYPSTVKQRKKYGDPNETVLTFDAYDKYGNLLQQTLKNGLKESFYYGYNKTLPIAKMVNVSNNYGQYSLPKIENETVATSTSSKSITFTSYYQGDITLAIRVTGPPTEGFFVSTRLYNSDFEQNISLCFAYGFSGCGPSSPSTITYPDVPAGTYTISFFANKAVYANLDYTYQGMEIVSSGAAEFYFNNFEDNSSAGSGDAHTGNRCSSSGSTVVYWRPPNDRTYVISYWYRSNGVWHYSGELPFSPPSDQWYILTGQEAYDDIRVHPKDAQMTTYTYDPLVGMTSSSGPNGKTTYYYYDTYQRLERIEDQDHNVIEKYKYNYAH